MTAPAMPGRRPGNPNFSSGPCAKRPGWSTDVLKDAALGRSHRAKIGKSKLKQVIDEIHALLELPEDYRVGIVPASDTGAMEMALWSLLGSRPVDVLAWESFGLGWVTDVVKQLKLDDARVMKADYGRLPDLSAVNFDHDVVFAWNGTTSGVRVPNGDWIAGDRRGLTICDATSAAFAQDIPFDKLDVATFSWQKALGGEGAHGILILSPRAVERLETTTPPWPMPKLFRMTKGGKLNEGIFAGATINTPSMLCVEDCLDALAWGRSVGGLAGMQARVGSNFAVLSDWVERTDWVDFFAEDPASRSNTSICLKVVDPAIASLDGAGQEAFVRAMVSRLDGAGAAYDINYHRDAPPHLRIWAGATIESSDLEILTEWLGWAYEAEKLTPAATV
jgi:phosphoserine aminotransferase